MHREISVREFGMDHSEMAMQAAKLMRHSKQKQKTGRVVCHHLRMMLVTDQLVARSFLSGSSPKAGEKQFALGF